MKILKKLYSSIILLFLGLLIAKTRILFGDGCVGMPDVFQFAFLCIIYGLTLAIILIVSTIKYYKYKNSFNYFPIPITLIVIGLVYLAIEIDAINPNTTLYATKATTGWNDRILTLREDNTFQIQMREVEWSCFYKGQYKIRKDTLFLERNDIQSETDSVFSDKYLIVHNQKMLYPLDKLEYLKDTTRWLKIEKTPD